MKAQAITFLDKPTVAENATRSIIKPQERAVLVLAWLVVVLALVAAGVGALSQVG